MAAWVKLCIHVMRAEFPHFEAIQRFAVMDVQGHLNKHRSMGSKDLGVDTLVLMFLLCTIGLCTQGAG